MIYSWSVSTKLRIWHVKPLFSLGKTPWHRTAKKLLLLASVPSFWHIYWCYRISWQITPNRNNQQIAKLRHVNYHGTLFSPRLSLCFSCYLCLSIPVNYFVYETRERGQRQGRDEIWHADADGIQWRPEEAISALRCQKIKALTELNPAKI